MNPNSLALSFSRPTGVYLLDPDMPEDQRPNDTFLTGEMHRIKWADIDNGDPNPVDWNWAPINDAVANLPPNQDLSLDLAVEPCDIATNGASMTWCDTVNKSQLEACPHNCGPNNEGVLRPVPWDPDLIQRRDKFLQAVAQHVIPATGNTVAAEPLIPIVNPNLPGGDAGIRELDGNTLSADLYPGYTRDAFLGTVEDELLTVLRNFPGKFVQIGFFTVEDNLDSQFSDESLWHYLYRKLAIGEFNGRTRPRVHFFQEDLAATRASAAADYIPYVPPPNTTPYSFTPNHCQLPAFAYNCGNDVDVCNPLILCTATDQEYNNGIVYQANTPWSGPSGDGDKVTKTINGNPNDGLEAAFNAYLNEYLEVYKGDADHAKAPAGMPAAWDSARWAAGLQSWKDYSDHLRSLAPVEGPAGLTVARDSATSNAVSWYAPYGAASYTLQRRSLSPLGDWTDVTGCDPASTSCTDTTSTGSQYAYRVQASNGDGTILSPWSRVAVFVSEGSYDGYVIGAGATHTPVSNGDQPGIQAGQGTSTDLIGFVSFNTASLGQAATILDAKLRLKQSTSNDAFDSLGTCMVDIRTGDFSSSAVLEGADFTAIETDFDVTVEGQLAGVDAENWVEAQLDPSFITDVNNTDRTQFRIYFDHVDGMTDKTVGWYSGESVGNEPQLIVQYTEPD
jgi:hypothetical protein